MCIPERSAIDAKWKYLIQRTPDRYLGNIYVNLRYYRNYLKNK